MRLKGGKVFIDTTYNDWFAHPLTITLNKETIDAILEKGLDVAVRFKDVKVVIPFVPHDFNYTDDKLTQITTSEIFKDNIETYRIILNIGDDYELILGEL